MILEVIVVSSIALSVISVLASIITIWVVTIKMKGFYINLYNMSKGLDILWGNQQKIIELTKIKGFIQLTNEEEQNVRKEISEERHKALGRSKKTEKLVRSFDGNKDDKTT